MNWSVAQATGRFESLVQRAFTTRSLLRPISWILGTQAAHVFGQLNCNFLFRSDAVESAYKEAFSDNLKLFGKAHGNSINSCKVAVLATGDADQRPFLLTNYNREWRADDDESECYDHH